jgi:5-methylcytosine-specific restriction endonuclease McrA
MSENKKLIRANFRDTVFKRDGYKCKMCGWNKELDKLDSHHITDRTLIINGGYVKENGISLCPECHIKAEQFHTTGISYPGYSPEELYAKIGSNHVIAISKSERL